jgi:hypothetical protein
MGVDAITALKSSGVIEERIEERSCNETPGQVAGPASPVAPWRRHLVFVRR